jgi:hypothetical protein
LELFHVFGSGLRPAARQRAPAAAALWWRMVHLIPALRVIIVALKRA